MTISDPFPLLSRQAGEGCTYLRRNAIHRDLNEGLKRSILVVAQGSNQNGGGTPGNVQHYLYCTYGGTYMQYDPLKYSKDIFLIQLPAGLAHEEVIDAGNEWGSSHEWSFRYFDIDEDAGMQSKTYRVRLHITNFPLDFWHETFIQDACAGFGEVRHIDEEFLHRNDRSRLALEITCIDPRRIPPATTLPYGNKWKKMFIYIAGWEYNQWIPEEAKLTTNEKRSLASLTEGTADLYRISLIAAHDKLTRYQSTPEPPSPPTSPPYPFSDFSNSEAAPSHGKEKIIKCEGTTPTPTRQHGAPATDIPTAKEKEGKGTWLPFNKCEQQGTVQIGTSTISTQCPLAYSVKVGEIEIDLGYTHQSEQLMHTQTPNSSRKIVESPDFKSFSMHMVKVGQINVLQRILTNHKQGPTLLNLQQIPHGCSNLKENHHSPIPVRQEKTGVRNIVNKNSTRTFPKNPSLLKGQIHPLRHTLWHNSSNEALEKAELNANLGPVNHTPPYHAPSKTHIETHKTIIHPTAPTIQHNFSLPHNLTMEMSNDDFIEQFAALSSEPEQIDLIPLAQHGAQTQDWHLCALARLISDRPALLSQLSSTMMTVWRVNPRTEISVLASNLFMIEFVTPQDLARVMQRGTWTYRGDLVVLKQLTGPPDLTKPTVTHMEIWTQWHRIPTRAISAAGLLSLAEKELGTPLSAALPIFANGISFYKIKLLVEIGKPFKDKLGVTHPTLGDFMIYLVYEQLNKICLFCGKTAHEQTNCVEKTRMARLKLDPRYRDMPHMKSSTQNRFGPWINNMALLPLPTPMQNGNSSTHSPNPQPTYSQPGPQGLIGPHHQTHYRARPPVRPQTNSITSGPNTYPPLPTAQYLSHATTTETYPFGMPPAQPETLSLNRTESFPSHHHPHHHFAEPLITPEPTTHGAPGSNSNNEIEDLNNTYSAMDLVVESVQHASKKRSVEAMKASAPPGP